MIKFISMVHEVFDSFHITQVRAINGYLICEIYEMGDIL